MKFLVCLSVFLSSLIITAQNNFTDADAKAIIDTFFDGFHKGDTTMMKSVMIDKLPTQTVLTSSKGENIIQNSDGADLLQAIGGRPAEQKWEERLLDYRVQIDGNLAHVWTPYEFWYNGNFSHCGANAFTLAKTNMGWKIIHLIDSRRKSDCKTE